MQQPGLNAQQIKWLGCLFMLVDHIGFFLFPQVSILRMVGRLAFPLFAFMVANGYFHTRSLRRYLLRLFLFALFYQPVYNWCVPGKWNIFLTLALGLAAIALYDKAAQHKKLWLSIPAVAAVCTAACLLHADYSFYGVLLVFTAYLGCRRKEMLVPAWVVLHLLILLPFSKLADVQLFALGALPFLFLYNGQRGQGNRWLFYLFYCVHIPLLYGLAQLL